MTILMTRRLGGALPTLALALLLLPATATAEDFVVTNLDDSGPGSLRQAILDGNGEADTITFAPALAGGTVLLSSGQLVIANDTADPDLTIDGGGDGDGTPDITIDAQGNSRVFIVANPNDPNANATLQGLVITGGNEDVGGGIFNDGGTLTVTNSTISGNRADFGGGILNDGGMLAVTNSTISGNSASFGGGISHGVGGTATVTNSTISGNSADFGGGIRSLFGTLITVANSTISGNSASFGGGSSPQTGPASSMKSLARSRSRAPSSPATRIVIAATTAPSPRWGSTSMATGRAASPRPATSRTSRSRTCS